MIDETQRQTRYEGGQCVYDLRVKMENTKNRGGNYNRYCEGKLLRFCHAERFEKRVLEKPSESEFLAYAS
jgi:hypothetical protein